MCAVAAPAPLSVAPAEEHLDGNLCRCTGYRPIWDAARSLCSDGADVSRERDAIRSALAAKVDAAAAGGGGGCCGGKGKAGGGCCGGGCKEVVSTSASKTAGEPAYAATTKASRAVDVVRRAATTRRAEGWPL